MTAKELTYLLNSPEKLKKDQIKDLEKLIATFPYFQAARVLSLKLLKDQQSYRYNQELRKTAAYTIDREVLFDFITSSSFTESEITKEKPKKEDIAVIDAEEIKVLERISIDEAVKMNIEEAEEVLDPSLFTNATEEDKEQQVSSQEEEGVTEEGVTEDPKAILKINSPLEFDKKENHSFVEWLRLTNAAPIERESEPAKEEKTDIKETQSDTTSTDTTTTNIPIEKKFELIDDFIANNPKIKPAAKNSAIKNLAKDNQIAPDELMTETLAKVYLAQNNYKKAIQAYKILILKNPEKSGFFADQIRAIEKLQENK
ncbi:hypothetical protein [Aquimarina brevivitae]|uniref:Tetratricopeptide repeat protein n=1 Tax=Aquimarina brevivitae TaxID=323412 RepID=A0A4V2F7H2_9FLAO|nr:hypothetical protein [Aquimarina brevivitae]RZS99809.1 hypothetical protein EV197_1036 [Aquimarina brevivitae]